MYIDWIGWPCSGFLRSWKSNGLDERVLQRVNDILTEPGSKQRHVYVTGCVRLSQMTLCMMILYIRLP
jgi:hypothetical protein